MKNKDKYDLRKLEFIFSYKKIIMDWLERESDD